MVCGMSADRHIRRNLLNDTILTALKSVEILSIREPLELSSTDAKSSRRDHIISLVPRQMSSL